MLKDWKTELDKELEYVIEIQNEALGALEKSKSKISAANLAEARKMMAEGRQYLNIVKFGNGVHNKKYSIMLFDAAIASFEDTMDFLEESFQVPQVDIVAAGSVGQGIRDYKIDDIPFELFYPDGVFFNVTDASFPYFLEYAGRLAEGAADRAAPSQLNWRKKIHLMSKGRVIVKIL